MTIIDITNPREIPRLSHCYVAEPSAEVVAHEHHQRYGYTPDVLYRRTATNGRISYYVPIERGNENASEIGIHEPLPLRGEDQP